MPLGGGIVDADGALAVGLLAQGPAVLALDADGVLALLGEGGVINDEDRSGSAKVLAMWPR